MKFTKNARVQPECSGVGNCAPYKLKQKGSKVIAIFSEPASWLLFIFREMLPQNQDEITIPRCSSKYRIC